MKILITAKVVWDVHPADVEMAKQTLKEQPQDYFMDCLAEGGAGSDELSLPVTLAKELACEFFINARACSDGGCAKGLALCCLLCDESKCEHRCEQSEGAKL